MTTTAEWRKWNAMQTKPVTNYDRIIRKTPEELAKHLACQWKECKNMDVDCDKCLLDWLKEEANEADS